MITNGWNWDLADYIIAGFLVLVASSIYRFTMKKIHTPRKRFVVIGLIIFGFIYVWAELAVGIFTNLGS